MSTRYDLYTQRQDHAASADIDVGLRAYMLRVYNYMALGIAFTGLVAWFAANSPGLLNILFGTPLMWVVMLAPIGFAFFFGARIEKMKASTAQSLFWLFAGLMGLAIAPVILAYTGHSIARTFFVTAGAFGGLSLWGYTTKRDLSPIGAFCAMGLIGLILASVVNIFLGNAGLDFAISVIGVLIFAGLTAWDTQQIKNSYNAYDNESDMTKKSIYGAFRLYLDFINIFLFLIQFLGDRR